jgi:membrane associated rhomboid family serine protease
MSFADPPAQPPGAPQAFEPATPPAPAIPATKALVIVCCAIFVIEVLLGFLSPQLAMYLNFRLALIPGFATGAFDYRFAWLDWLPGWTGLFTSLFLHGGWLHIAFNMFYLWFLGRVLEPVIGPLRLVGLFLLCGLAGSVVEVLSDPQSSVPVVGASGSISGMLAMFLLLIGRTDGEPGKFLGIRLSGLQLRMLALFGVWLLIQGLTGLVMNPGGAGGGVAIWAHIGGFAMGLILAYPMRKARDPSSV